MEYCGHFLMEAFSGKSAGRAAHRTCPTNDLGRATLVLFLAGHYLLHTHRSSACSATNRSHIAQAFFKGLDKLGIGETARLDGTQNLAFYLRAEEQVSHNWSLSSIPGSLLPVNLCSVALQRQKSTHS